MEQWAKVGNIYDPENYHLVHYIENALTAHVPLRKRDKEYVVRDGQVVIVDEFTGRLQPGRRWADGLHQAVEAKEGLKVQRESITYATITLQNYFRMYEKLAGMTGTATTEAEEFFKIYRLDVVAMPTNVPMIREEFSDLIFKTRGRQVECRRRRHREFLRKASPRAGGHHIHRGFGEAERPPQPQGHTPRDTQRKAARERSPDHRSGRPSRRSHRGH